MHLNTFSTIQLIFPTRNLRRLRLWEEYFLRYDCTALAQQAKTLDHDMIDQEPIAVSLLVHTVCSCAAGRLRSLYMSTTEWQWRVKLECLLVLSNSNSIGRATKTPYTVSISFTYLVKLMWLTLRLRICSIVSNTYNSDLKVL